MLEKTLLLLKPDAQRRGLTQEILSRIEKAGLKIEISKELNLTMEQASRLYEPHLGKHFYQGLVKYITSGSILACVVSGENAINRLRKLVGATDPRQAEKGTIRGDLREAEVVNEDGIIKNLVHASDSFESAQREIAIFF